MEIYHYNICEVKGSIMKNSFKKIFAISLLSACFAVTAAGCANNNSENDSGDGNVVSYVSVNSSVYSSTAEAVEAVADTVVEIRTESVATQWGMQYIVSGAGSGVIVGQDNDLYYIVTNNHVIDGANDITVSTRAGTVYEATLVATDDSTDIAVVTVTSETELQIAVWGNSDDLKIGEDLIAIGNPLGSLGGTVTKGILSAKGRSISVGDYAMTLLQTDTAINPGNSGGGLFNMKGELIGVVNAKTTDEEIEGICFAIPANTARAVYGDLINYGYINGRATLNLTLAQGSISGGGINAQPQSIVYVTDAGNAAEGTFKQYDRIYSINGKTVSTILEYNTAMSQIKAGDNVQVEVYRGQLVQNWLSSSITFDQELTSFTVQAAQYGLK